MAQQDLWDKIWRDKNDNVVIWQTPNFLLIGWVIATIITIFVTGTLSTVFWYIALALLIIWSLLEVFKGVNYFRRALGVVVLILIIAAFFKVGY